VPDLLCRRGDGVGEAGTRRTAVQVDHQYPRIGRLLLLEDPAEERGDEDRGDKEQGERRAVTPEALGDASADGGQAARTHELPPPCSPPGWAARASVAVCPGKRTQAALRSVVSAWPRSSWPICQA